MTEEIDWWDWFTQEPNEAIDLGRPGIYEWDIGGVGSYIGQSRNLHSRVERYVKNIRNLTLGEQPYYPFRPIHYDLADARACKRLVTYRVRENCDDPEERNERERYWIKLRGTLNGPRPRGRMEPPKPPLMPDWMVSPAYGPDLPFERIAINKGVLCIECQACGRRTALRGASCAPRRSPWPFPDRRLRARHCRSAARAPRWPLAAYANAHQRAAGAWSVCPSRSPLFERDDGVADRRETPTKGRCVRGRRNGAR